MVMLVVVGFMVAGRHAQTHGKASQEPFTTPPTRVVLRGPDIYDETYADLYNKVRFDKQRFDVEVSEVRRTLPRAGIAGRAIDVGCGTGHHVYALGKLGTHAIGVDASPAMVAKATQSYNEAQFLRAEALNDKIADDGTLTHVLCLNYTLYEMPDQQRFFERCHRWLMPGGVLLVHMVDPELVTGKAQTRSSLAPPKLLYGGGSRDSEASAPFSQWEYQTAFKYFPGESRASLDEIIRDTQTGSTRYHEHLLHMLPLGRTIQLAKSCGFIVVRRTALRPGHVGEYIYTLQKAT